MLSSRDVEIFRKFYRAYVIRDHGANRFVGRLKKLRRYVVNDRARKLIEFRGEVRVVFEIRKCQTPRGEGNRRSVIKRHDNETDSVDNLRAI